jgi:hypothetical protein
VTVNIEKSDHGLTVKLDGKGSLAFFLRTLIRAKFYDDDGLDGLLSPLLNDAIRTTIETIEPDQSEVESWYSGWVAEYHVDRVRDLVSSSADYLSASPLDQQEMLRTALYPYRPIA